MTRKGFTVVAFEANWSATGAADDYVKGGAGTAAAALERLGFWVWRTEEVGSLIEWMRGENLRRKGKNLLSFTGFDIQQLNIPSACVLDVFAKLGGGDLARLDKLYGGAPGSAKSSASPQSAKELEALLADIRGRAREALGIVDGRRAELVAVSSESEFQRARQCARVIVQNAENLGTGLLMTVRDQAMADNVRWLSDVAYPARSSSGRTTAMSACCRAPWAAACGRFSAKTWWSSASPHHGEIRANPVRTERSMASSTL